MADAPPAELLLFANPHSGLGRSLRAADAAAEWARRRGRATRQVHDRDELAALLAAEPQRWPELWVCGGDGTLADVAQRLRRGVRPVIGLLPTGTGNVVARSLAIPLDLAGALAVAQSGEVRRFDLARANGRAFTFMVSVGLDAEIAAEVAARRRGPMRRSDWVKAAWRAASYAREAPVRVRADGRDLGEARYVALFNCALYAGSFRVCPSARFDDGWLDLLLLREPLLPRWPSVCLAALRGRPHRLADGLLVRARAVELLGAAAVQQDGDPVAGGDLAIALDPEPLRLRAPPR